MKLWKRTVLLMLVTLLCALIPVGTLSLYITGKRSLNNAAETYGRQLEMVRYSWNNFGITANMSRCPRLERRPIWDFNFNDAVGPAWR